jgi:phosphoglycerate-specific signal transduction histidine kinase
MNKKIKVSLNGNSWDVEIGVIKTKQILKLTNFFANFDQSKLIEYAKNPQMFIANLGENLFDEFMGIILSDEYKDIDWKEVDFPTTYKVIESFLAQNPELIQISKKIFTYFTDSGLKALNSKKELITQNQKIGTGSK